VLTCENLVEEIQGVLSRPKFKKYLKHSDIKEVISLHLKLCQLIGTQETTNQLTDTRDNFLLDLYNKGKATILVSGDKALLREASELNYRVMTLREFELSYSL
jgi:putative PIN family toxin of toxin-antitoxin system